MTATRFLLAILILCGLAILLVCGSTFWLAVAAIFCISVEIVVRRASRWLMPALLFSVMLALLEWIGHDGITTLPLKAILSYVALALGFRIMPWLALLRLVPTQSFLFLPVLFLLFVRHFTFILHAEAVRILTAYRLAVPHSFRRGGFRALAWSLDSFFRRSLLRAERFYAAQLLKGLTE